MDRIEGVLVGLTGDQDQAAAPEGGQEEPVGEVEPGEAELAGLQGKEVELG